MKISVMGDSMSTFQGYSNNIIDPNDHGGNYYPTNESSVNTVDKTWWWKTIGQLNATIVSNDSIGGSCIGGYNDACQSAFDAKLFINSYSNLVRMIFERYSNKITILCITPYKCKSMEQIEAKYLDVCNGIATVVNHYRSYGYDCKLVSMMDMYFCTDNGFCNNNDHPTAAGMQQIADRVAYVQQYGYQ
ncbi:MAG: SGNH/GDSL hydrolase family protein [Lachnospiraceae bacterium]|nr:SGNH/GDSL hydrolase family protein [Lachnospiraceae bacterium]